MGEPDRREDAPLGRWAASALVDLGALATAALAGIGATAFTVGPIFDPPALRAYAAGATAGAALLLGLQLIGVALRGQSVGKRVAGLRLSGADPTGEGLLRGGLLRAAPVALVGASALGVFWSRPDLALLPPLLAGGALLAVLDGAGALGPGRRTLRDRLAGTQVRRATVALSRGAPR